MRGAERLPYHCSRIAGSPAPRSPPLFGALARTVAARRRSMPSRKGGHPLKRKPTSPSKRSHRNPWPRRRFSFSRTSRSRFGSTPLLEGATLSIGAGERLCLVGRNGSGKSTLLKIAAGLIEPDGGSRFLQPGATVRYLPQEPGPHRLCHHGRLRRGGARPGRRSAPGALSPGEPRAHRRGGSQAPLGRRGAPRGARSGAGAGPRHSAARRADQPSRRGGHRVVGGGAQGLALGAGADQP